MVANKMSEDFGIEEVETSASALMQGCKCPDDLAANIKRRVSESQD